MFLFLGVVGCAGTETIVRTDMCTIDESDGTKFITCPDGTHLEITPDKQYHEVEVVMVIENKCKKRKRRHR
jgi:hypothetical protein